MKAEAERLYELKKRQRTSSLQEGEQPSQLRREERVRGKRKKKPRARQICNQITASK